MKLSIKMSHMLEEIEQAGYAGLKSSTYATLKALENRGLIAAVFMHDHSLRHCFLTARGVDYLTSDLDIARLELATLRAQVRSLQVLAKDTQDEKEWFSEFIVGKLLEIELGVEG